ncbi:putative GABA permease [Aspergillus candidus]|uniref:Amino acid transporter n=1 Tax=Aspergillus candidus TaxID=41067 RepID=A0A2I2FEU3_ASPCN|nr:amino acid transporter [Aspergillus candidus]PLB39140.1 amino acid transporter [Aspergillus candidus]
MADCTTLSISKMPKTPDQLDSATEDSDHTGSRMGDDQEELPRQFSLLSTLALGFSMTNSWLGYSATFITPLLMGGSPAVFFGLVGASIASSLITAGLAELASAYPSSGGQYHFAYMVSSPRYRAPVAFAMGWLSVIAWALTSASTAVVCAQMTGNLASIYNPSYTPEPWQTYLIYTALVLISTAIVCLLPRALPRGEIVMFISSFLGFVASFVTVLATQKHKRSATAVFLDYKNLSGWNDGTSFLLGLGTSMYAYLAIDGACHIAEELPNPGRDVPRAMGLTMLIGATTVFPWTVAFLFAGTDNSAVASSSIPIYTIYLQATQSHSAATVLTVWVLFVYSGALVSCIAPVNATVGCSVAIIIYGLIYIGSTTAFNSFITMSILSLNLTYAVPQAIILFRGRERILPKRSFALGPYLGRLCNAFSALWVPFITIIFCFPTSLPTTVSSMNYVSVVIIGISFLILVSWCGGKHKTFSGPKIVIQGLEVVP